MREGFAADDIVILTARGLNRSVLAGRNRVGTFAIRRFESYDEFGNQIYTEGQIRFDSVRRFKGGEAAAVILADVDPDPRRIDLERRLLYAGMTRATVALDVLARRGNPANESFQAAIAAARATLV
jgi:superfamily I DNA and RNA helicase